MPALDVYFYGKKIGTLTEKNSRLSFKYNEDADTPLSVNLPLQKEAFNDKLTRSFFNNLLPEEGIREAVARYKQVSSNNPFALFNVASSSSGLMANANSLLWIDSMISLCNNCEDANWFQ